MLAARTGVAMTSLFMPATGELKEDFQGRARAGEASDLSFDDSLDRLLWNP